MLKERDMNHNTNTQRTANSDGAPVKMGRVVNFIDVDDLDSDETGNYGPMPPAVGMSKSKVSRVNAPRAQSHASAANSARTIKQDSKQNSLSKTMNAKPCASAASLNANSSVSNKKSSSPGPVVPAIGSTTMQKRVISNIEGIPKKALAGPNAQLDSPPPATIPLTETQFDPKSSDKAINYLKRPRRKSSGAGNTVVSTEEQLGGNSTSEDRKTVLHAVESGTQSQVQKRSQISPSNYAPSQAQISSLVGTAKGSLNIRVGPDGVVNMSTDDEDNSPPPKAVKLSPPPAREKPQSQHSIQRPNRNRVKRKIENVAHTETVPRKSTHVNSDDRPMAMNTNTNTNTNTNATTYTNATKLDTSTGTIKTANTKPSTTSRKTTDGKSATTRRRVVPYLLESGSDTLSKRGVRITSRSSYRTTEQLDSSSEDDDDSDGTPGPPAALVWGKRDKLYKPAGISQKQKGGMSNSGLISRNGTKTKAESIVCSIANGADMKPWDRSTSATGIVHVKRPKYLDCQSEQIGAWRKKKTSKTKHNLSFDKTGNVKGYSSIMRSQMDIAIRAAELSRHTEYKETDREKLGVDDLTGDDVILDILENAVLILDDNGDENESIYGYFVDEPCPASSTQRSRARNSDESRVPMELPTKPPVVERGVANNKAIVNTTDEHSMQGPSRVNENTLSKRPESALSQAQAFSLPARVTRRSGSVYAGEKKGRTSEEMFQQIASRNESRPWNSIAKGRRMTNEGNMVDAAEEQRLKEQSKKFYREQLQLERDVFGFDHTPYTPDFVPAESPEPEEEVEHNNHCSTCCM